MQFCGSTPQHQQQPLETAPVFEQSVLATRLFIFTNSNTVSRQALAVVPAAALTTAVDHAHSIAFQATEVLNISGHRHLDQKAHMLLQARLQTWVIFQKVILACIILNVAVHAISVLASSQPCPQTTHTCCPRLPSEVTTSYVDYFSLSSSLPFVCLLA